MMARDSDDKEEKAGKAKAKAKKVAAKEKEQRESLASRIAKQTLRASLWPYRSVAFGRSTINLTLLRFFPSASGVKIKKEVISGVPGERHRPKNALPDRKILYLHGGGYSGGSPATHRSMVSRMAWVCRSEIFVPNYRKAPRHPFPAALRDVQAVWLKFIREDPEARYFLAGDSAGGGLCAALLYQLRDQDHPLPTGAILLSPWMDVRMENPEIFEIQSIDPMLRSEELRHYGEQYAGSHDLDEPLISPVEGKPAGLCPLLIHVGSADILCPDTRIFAKKAIAAGVQTDLEVWPSMMHVWHAAGILPESRKAMQRIKEWINERIAAQGPLASLNTG